mmetsp:Transcript_44676/g.107727  ORF Transcript_44676/g.107727 Transcript_44676/m.107727 type:complete len:204 (-) Transcript_44676:1751-2362(-)
MELDFCRSGIDHWSWPNGHDGRSWIQATWMVCSHFQDFFMLLDANIQRNIVRLGPTTQWRQPQDGILVSLTFQVFSSRFHQVGVTCMSGVSGLKGIDSIGTLVVKFLKQFGDCLAPLIQSIIVDNPLEQFNLTTNQIISSGIDIFNVRMSHVNRSKHASHNLFLAVFINLDIAQNGNHLAHSRHQGDILFSRLLNRVLGKFCE